MDAGYGSDTGLRTDITALGLRYVAGIGPNTSVVAAGRGSHAAAVSNGSRTTQTRLQRGPNSRSQSRHSPSIPQREANDHLARGNPH
jgi:hypothetical protein